MKTLLRKRVLPGAFCGGTAWCALSAQAWRAAGLPEQYRSRLSFCCAVCRCRIRVLGALSGPARLPGGGCGDVGHAIRVRYDARNVLRSVCRCRGPGVLAAVVADSFPDIVLEGGVHACFRR
jgi:hypothetical protein